MSNKILTDDGWQERIRNKIGVNIAYLPDSVIGQPDHITVAEENIIAIFPDYASFTDVKKVYLEAATVCECAILLCQAMAIRLPKREQGPHFTKDSQNDWGSIKAGLESERDMHVAKIDPSYSTNVMHFGLTKSS